MPEPYHGCHFESTGIRFVAKSRDRKAGGQLLSSPYSITQAHRSTTSTYKRANGQDSGKPIQDFAKLTNRATIPDGLSVFYFDKNRNRQLTQGTYKTTFERICDDLNWRFVKELNKDPAKLRALEEASAGDYFALAKNTAQGGVGEKVADELAEFLEDDAYKSLRVDLVNYLHPFTDARLAVRQDDSLQQVLARDLGSGVEIRLGTLVMHYPPCAFITTNVYDCTAPGNDGTAPCNGGERATGGGYAQPSDGASVTISESKPSPTSGTPTGWTVGAFSASTSSTSSTHADTVVPIYAVCAAP
ncbi:MAG: hypothetical protein JOZ89_07080 [Gammaproteobacteria bacterium]|nr:hypothetical protein [Gammaproteobacteria bacterium]